MYSTLAVVLVGCVAAVSAVTLVKGPIESVADYQRDMYVDNGVYAHGRGVNKNQNNNLQVRHIGIQKDQDDIDARFNGPQPTGGVLHYTFKPDFEALINPKNNYSDWRWAMTSYNNESVNDNGTILHDESKNSIKLVSIPYSAWVPQDNNRVAPIHNAYEALLVNKQNITVLPGQKLAVNVRFSCKTYNTEDSPHADIQDVVSKPEDDPSLASCGFGIMSYDESALALTLAATNKGIWVLYQRNRYELFAHPERNQKEFTIFKKIAERSSPYETIDATIQYDHAQNVIHFMLNGKKVYTLSDLGTINQIIREDKSYSEVYNPQREDLQQRVEPQDFQVVLGLFQFPDTVDPNHPSNPPLRGSRLTTDPAYYEDNAKFHDNENVKMYSIFGQGAEMTLVSANIKLEGTATGQARPNPSNVVVRGGRRQQKNQRSGRRVNENGARRRQDEEKNEEVYPTENNEENQHNNPQ